MKYEFDDFYCIIADTPAEVLGGGGIELYVMKDQFDTLLKICSQSKKCLSIIYDFRESEEVKE